MGIAEKIYQKLKDAPEPIAQEVLEFLRSLEKRSAATTRKDIRSMDDYAGCMKDSDTFSGDPLKIQHDLRDDWDRKWD